MIHRGEENNRLYNTRQDFVQLLYIRFGLLFHRIYHHVYILDRRRREIKPHAVVLKANVWGHLFVLKEKNEPCIEI